LYFEEAGKSRQKMSPWDIIAFGLTLSFNLWWAVFPERNPDHKKVKSAIYGEVERIFLPQPMFSNEYHKA